ncbi:hypothetical protein FAZ69_13415 [Trinickia terrae]|uniref:Lysine-specific metallo-endopeptidase domain-containing protein n=1 Tax=Trinickia terrae TaxID=2571161 RepID=A0A4U1I6B7_9BURK|nr:hypothetical protein [Trinickia terrae]TKC88745.1 hypothetical protein FAZ69_13415 [Trinickia terrae]
MQYINIAKAMEEIAITDMGAILADHIASSLSKKNRSQVEAINQALNFSFPLFRTRPINGNRILELRRAAMLISKTFETPSAPLPRGGRAPHESWDEQDLEVYIGQQKQAAERKPKPAGAPGPYLGASFWAYATEDERSTAITGYRESLELCTFGLLAATHATRAAVTGPSQMGIDIYADLVRIWFGSAPGTAEKVRDALHKTLSGLKTRYIRLGYGGKNVRAVGANTFKEAGFGDGGAKVGNISAIGNGIFAYAPSKSSGVTDQFVLGKLFFDSQHTTIGLTNQIVAIDDEEKMDVTRSGAVVHEATHMYAGTIDVPLSDAVYDSCGWEHPGVKDKRKLAYGAQRCLSLAKSTPTNAAQSALDNADTYRIFCELAKYHRQHAGAPVVIR